MEQKSKNVLECDVSGCSIHGMDKLIKPVSVRLTHAQCSNFYDSNV